MQRAALIQFMIAVMLVLVPTGVGAVVLDVGPGKTYATPSAAASVAQDGDVIEIDAGEYLGDVTAWYANDLVIRGVGGMAHLRANGNDAQGKAIWVIGGNNTTIEYIEFSEASVVDKNGAGIRQEGTGLTVRHCYFHDNENGILAGDDAASDIVIEFTEFARNGFGGGFTHNLYINHVRSLTFQFNYSHHARIGHNLKSRAYANYVLYNRLMDEATGDSSRLIDLPNGGLAYVIGNLLHQSPSTDNSNLFCFACEGASNPTQELYVVNNTFVNDRSAGSFIQNQSSATALVANNIFVGNGTTTSGPTTEMTNLVVASDPGFVDMAGYDYALTAGATAAIDQGSDPGTGATFVLWPGSHYSHPAAGLRRPVVAVIDIGAYEYGTAGGSGGSAGTGGSAGAGGSAGTGGTGGVGGSGGSAGSSGTGGSAGSSGTGGSAGSSGTGGSAGGAGTGSGDGPTGGDADQFGTLVAGCDCDAGGSGTGSALLVLCVVAFAARRRRRT